MHPHLTYKESAITAKAPSSVNSHRTWKRKDILVHTKLLTSSRFADLARDNKSSIVFGFKSKKSGALMHGLSSNDITGVFNHKMRATK